MLGINIGIFMKRCGKVRKIYTKESTEWQIFNDIWVLLKDFGEIENTREYWEEFEERLYSINNKYQGNEFVKDLLLAVLNEFERKNKG